MIDVLLTNDDGPRSAPFTALMNTLSKRHNLKTIIPSGERSWIGKSISASTIPPLRRIDVLGQEVNLVDGTPADCVQLGLYNILPERPDMVVSGMNIGENVGVPRMLSSGTLGGAIEAAMAGVRAISVSVVFPPGNRNRNDVRDPGMHEKFGTTAEAAVDIMDRLSKVKRWKDFHLVSINLPFGSARGSDIEVTRPSFVSYGQLFIGSNDGFIHANPPLENEEGKEGTDVLAISRGRISITPVCLDMTTDTGVEVLRTILEDDQRTDRDGGCE